MHPAFTDKIDFGGWSENLAGIWVAKFEASHTDCTTDEYTGRYNGTDKTLQVKPNVTSWRDITINNIFTVCYNYNKLLNSHLMKNSEWGAVAYLAQSDYGVGTENEIGTNQCQSLITGGSVAETWNIYYERLYSYTTSTGQNSSSTGNVYGIYDLVGGAWEYVASYVDNNDDSLSANGLSLVSCDAMKYKQVYSKAESGEESDSTNYKENKWIYGDAIWETSSNGKNSNSWNGDYSDFPRTSRPFYIRGGSYNTAGDSAGLFSFSYFTGSNSTKDGFRPVLIVL